MKTVPGVTVPGLFDDEESAFDPIVGDAIPHHARLADRDHMLKVDHLTGMEGAVSVSGAKAAGTVIEQPPGNLLMRWIVKRQRQLTFSGMTAFGAAIGG